MYASLHATLLNAHFVEPGGVNYTPEDVLGRGDREARKIQALKDKYITMQLQRIAHDPIDESLIPHFVLEAEANYQKATVN